MQVADAESWATIPNYPKYEISTHGRVRSANNQHIMKIGDHNSISLSNHDGQHPWSIQVLMGCTYLGNDINDLFRSRVLFKDKDSSNVHLSNLYIEDTSDLLGEEWRPFSEFNGNILKPYYMISNKGRVKSVRHTEEYTLRGKYVKRCYPDLIMQTASVRGGYIQAVLHTAEGRGISIPVHRMVGFAFIPNPNPELRNFINHIDGNPSNNCVENLEWCTPRENILHAYRTGLMDNAYHARLRYLTLHVETGEWYRSLTDVCRAMGRPQGYLHNRMLDHKPFKDIYGNVWTLEIHKDKKQRIYEEGKACYFEEYPGVNFISMLLASEFIGKHITYIADTIYIGKPILDHDGTELHLHFSDPELERQYQAGEMIKHKKEPQPKVGRSLKKGVSQFLYLEELPGIEFNSYVELSHYLGKADGYVGDCIKQNTPLKGKGGTIVHMHFLDPELDKKYQSGDLIQEKYRNKYKQGNNGLYRCFFDELPGQIFESEQAASIAIGKAGCYIHERIHSGKPLLNKDKQVVHLHFVNAEMEHKLVSGGFVREHTRKQQYNKTAKQKNLFNINPNLES